MRQTKQAPKDEAPATEAPPADVPAQPARDDLALALHLYRATLTHQGAADFLRYVAERLPEGHPARETLKTAAWLRLNGAGGDHLAGAVEHAIWLLGAS